MCEPNRLPNQKVKKENPEALLSALANQLLKQCFLA